MVPDIMHEVTPGSVVPVLRRRAEAEPNRLAFTFLSEDGAAAEHVTYGALDHDAAVLAAHLQERGLRGDRIALLFPTGRSFVTAFLGSLYAGVVAVPCPLPQGKGLQARVSPILEDSRPSLVLTTAADRARVLRGLHDVAPIREGKVDVLALDDLLAGATGRSWNGGWPSSDSLAFLQYTSGSTGTPKGVMVTHASLLDNQEAIRSAFGHGPSDVIVGWLPLFHDMGLVGNLLQPLYVGARCILMSPMAFLQRPARWLEAISRYRGTTSGGPNFAYERCAHKIPPEAAATLDLSSWRVAFCGAEPVRHGTLETFAEAFRACGFRRQAFLPCYGLAEATLFVSGRTEGTEGTSCLVLDGSDLARGHATVRGGSPGTQGTRTLVNCGRPAGRTRVAVVSPDSARLCKPGEVGEVWISGPGVAAGYWGRPEETRATFAAYTTDTGEGPFLRTGDLGFERDGLYLTGRLKDVIIVRGQNIYPSDIEASMARSHPLLAAGAGAAFGVDREGEEQVVVVQEVDRHARVAEWEDCTHAVRRVLAEEYSLAPAEVLLVRPGSVPRTSSGKVRRLACRDDYLSGRLVSLMAEAATATATGQRGEPLEYVKLPADPTHPLEQLTLYVAELVGVRPNDVATDRHLTSLGLDSLLMVRFQQRIQNTLGTHLSLPTLFNVQDLRELALQLVAAQSSAPPPRDAPLAEDSVRTPILPKADAGPHEQIVTPGQRALWYLHQLAGDSGAYHITSAFRFVGTPDIQALRTAFDTLLDRHEPLRTGFVSHDGEPAAQVSGRCSIPMACYDASGWTETRLRSSLEEEARSPFDLESPPLMRVAVYTRTADAGDAKAETVLLLCAHHIVTDLLSMATLADEFGRLYRASAAGASPPPNRPARRFADYAAEQAGRLNTADAQSLWTYWETQLAHAPEGLNLPTDRPRPPRQTFNGARHHFAVPGPVADGLRDLARRLGCTLHQTIAAVFSAWLHRYTGQQDILIGVPASGRTRAEDTWTVGYMTNPVVIRSRTRAGESFADLCQAMRDTVVGALEHQELPFACLAERDRTGRDLSRSPLFQVLFAFYADTAFPLPGLAALAIGHDGAAAEIGGLPVRVVGVQKGGSQFDLSLAVGDSGRDLLCCIEYNSDLFEASTVSRIAGHLQTLFAAVPADPERAVEALLILPERERQVVLREWNDTATDHGTAPGLLHQLVEDQVRRTPDAPAVGSCGQWLSYSELDQRANQVAHALRAVGIGPEARVGVCLERSTEMVIALLGVLKSGGAYVPLDPLLPPERLASMARDAGISALVAVQHAGVALTDGRGIPVPRLDVDSPWVCSAPEAKPEERAFPDGLAYVIFTSGSTGTPKGAMNTHRSIRNRLLWMQSAYELGSADAVVQKTPFSFDVSVWEFFWPLMTGARLVIAKPDGHKDPMYLTDLFRENCITTCHFVPSMLLPFLDEPGSSRLPSLRRVICSGEALPVEITERFFDRLPWVDLQNLYGPTEAAVDVTHWTCRPGGTRQSVPIGRPIANTQIYILDGRLMPVPIGVLGELYIGGIGVGRGYVGRPDLTAERFLPDPYSASPGARLYRTGDLARFAPDGSIEFLGRSDYQVKIRGFRVELGEIAIRLREHPRVRDCVVTARPAARRAVGAADAFSHDLVAYVVRAASNETQGHLETATRFRQFLRERLPDYMIPTHFVFLQVLPLNSNGKVDHAALPDPHEGSGGEDERSAGVVRARTWTERWVARIWSDVMQIPEELVDSDTSFFDMGGHSLLAMRVLARLRADFAISLEISVLFSTGFTVADLAATVEARIIEQGRPADVTRLRNEIDALTDEDVRRQVYTEPPASAA
jgi:amino acid adenylation domain-containing protein